MALSAQDNAYAERIIKTIKEEYLDHWKPANFEQLKRYTCKSVYHYNYRRPHNHLDHLPPAVFESKCINNEVAARPMISIYDNKDP